MFWFKKNFFFKKKAVTGKMFFSMLCPKVQCCNFLFQTPIASVRLSMNAPDAAPLLIFNGGWSLSFHLLKNNKKKFSKENKSIFQTPLSLKLKPNFNLILCLMEGFLSQ